MAVTIDCNTMIVAHYTKHVKFVLKKLFMFLLYFKDLQDLF